MTRPQIKVGNRKPYVDDAGDLHWPAVVMYPEPAQQDMIEDFCESNTIGALVLPPSICSMLVRA